MHLLDTGCIYQYVGYIEEMKNQYFGDINDYRKYGLIRLILHSHDFRLLISWMLTPDDASTDGRLTDYLVKPSQWRKYDCDLYDELQRLMINKAGREVSLIENTTLLIGAHYFASVVPDLYNERIIWSQDLVSYANNYDLIFLDPDNGLEVKSKPYGRKGSSKYLYWREVSSLWEQKKSLLIYQHFCREKRALFIERIKSTLQDKAEGSSISVFATPNVAFFLVLQPQHQKYLSDIQANVQNKWDTQIRFY